MTIVRQDTFARANVASGWGTATDGNAWTIQSGNGQSVQSNEGLVSASTASTFATLGAALSGADAEGLVRFGDVGSTDTAGIILRWTNSSNHWLCRYNGAGAIEAMVKVAGTYTKLTPNYTFTPGGTTFYWLRFRCQGTTISFKVWQDGTSEPASWTEQYTGQSSQDVAGASGLYGFAGVAIDFDHFSVDDLVNGIALTGELDSTLALTAPGGLSISRALSSTLAASAGLSGALTVQRALSGRLDAVASLTGALTVQRALSGRLDTQLGMYGTLTVGTGGPLDDTRRVPHKHIGRIEDQAGESSLEGV